MTLHMGCKYIFSLLVISQSHYLLYFGLLINVTVTVRCQTDGAVQLVKYSKL